MHTSGLLIVARPGQFDSCRQQVQQLDGLEIYVEEAGSGRLVAVLESDTVQQQEEGLRRVQGLASVLSAELAYHHFGEADPPSPGRTAAP